MERGLIEVWLNGLVRDHIPFDFQSILLGNHMNHIILI